MLDLTKKRPAANAATLEYRGDLGGPEALGNRDSHVGRMIERERYHHVVDAHVPSQRVDPGLQLGVEVVETGVKAKCRGIVEDSLRVQTICDRGGSVADPNADGHGPGTGTFRMVDAPVAVAGESHAAKDGDDEEQ